jgi:hypothetical protein
VELVELRTSSFAMFGYVSNQLKKGNFLAQSYTMAAALNSVIQWLDSQELLAQEINHHHFPL